MQRRLSISLVLVTACTSLNPEFDEPDSVGEDTTSSGVPGDGDPGDGDGDTGDTGDTGDGDGDGDTSDACAPPAEPGEPHTPLTIYEVSSITAINAPQFDLDYAANCYTMTICAAAQGNCGATTGFLARYHTGGEYDQGSLASMPTPIQLTFHSGAVPCGKPLMWGADQSLDLTYNDTPDGPDKTISILLPCVDGAPTTVWVGEDGSTFWDAALTEPAGVW